MGFSTRHIHNTEATMTDAPDPGLTDLIAAHYRTITTAVIYRDDESDGAHRKGFECVCACGDEYMASTRAGDRTEATVLRRADSAHVALVVEQHTNGRTAELGWDELVAAIPDGWELRESAQLEEVSRVRQRDLEASQATTARWRARADKAEAAIARVGAVIEDLVQNIADDEKTLRSPNVSVGEAQELPAVINVQKIYLKDLRAALEGEQQ